MARTTIRRVLVAASATILLAAGCGLGAEDGADTTTTAKPGSPEAEAAAKPIAIDAAIAASKNEGKLVVYGNPSAEQWEPVLAAFAEGYPWIKVETFDLGGAEAFQRYLTESATDSATADVIVNTDGAGWLDLVSRGEVVDYVDPELADLPDLAVAAPGVFTMSTDPLIGLFNKKALPLDEQPTTMAELAEMAPELDGKIGTIDVENGQAGLGTFGFVEAKGDDGWKLLEKLGPHTGVESGNGTLLGKLNSGEYVASFFVSGSIRALVDTTATGDVLNYRYFEDATVMPTRGIAVTKAAASPNSAKVLINFLLTEPGQEALCAGGFTPIRDGVECDQGLAAIQKQVGKDNAIVVGYPDAVRDDQEAFRARWNKAFGR